MMESEIEVETNEFRPRFFVTLLIYMCEFNSDLKKNIGNDSYIYCL